MQHGYHEIASSADERFDYTAIDFETASSFRGSPCSVGLVRVRGGRIVDTRHWLIRPPEGADHFDSWNMSIHGITAEKVAGAPRWRDILPELVEFIGDDVVIAHNASFDAGVVRYACEIDSLDYPGWQFLCTLVMSRKMLTLPSYCLPYVAEYLGLQFTDHHDALADARAVVDIVDHLSARSSANSLAELAASAGVP